MNKFLLVVPLGFLFLLPMVFGYGETESNQYQSVFTNFADMIKNYQLSLAPSGCTESYVTTVKSILLPKSSFPIDLSCSSNWVDNGGSNYYCKIYTLPDPNCGWTEGLITEIQHDTKYTLNYQYSYCPEGNQYYILKYYKWSCPVSTAPSYTATDWNCGAWGECASDGKQNRLCSNGYESKFEVQSCNFQQPSASPTEQVLTQPSTDVSIPAIQTSDASVQTGSSTYKDINGDCVDDDLGKIILNCKIQESEQKPMDLNIIFLIIIGIFILYIFIQ